MPGGIVLPEAIWHSPVKMLELTGNISGVAIGLDGKIHLTIDVNEEESIRAGYDKYKEIPVLDIKIQKHREHKSKEANAYFHALARQIATVLTVPFAQAKNMLICRYGQPETLEDGTQLTYMSPAPVEFMMQYEPLHTTPVGYEGDQTIYAVYRGVHTYSKEEMSQLIDGTVSDAMQLGIDVYPASKIKEIEENWTPGKG